MALDFEIIKTEDTTKILLADTSDWTGLTGSVADILLPGCETPETVTVNRNQLNSFTMGDLDVVGDRLPDGLYEITLKDSAGTVTKKVDYLRTTYMNVEMFRHITKNISVEESFSDSVLEMNNISLYIEAAHSGLREGDLHVAKYYYEQAKSKLDKIINCK
jgi:hypothetical protein